MFGEIFIPQNIWKKQLICLEVEISAATKLTVLRQNLCCKIKQHRTIDSSFRLHDQFYTEKYSKVFLWNAWNVLTKMQRKKGQILYITGRDDQIAIWPVPNCLILHMSLINLLLI